MEREEKAWGDASAESDSEEETAWREEKAQQKKEKHESHNNARQEAPLMPMQLNTQSNWSLQIQPVDPYGPPMPVQPNQLHQIQPNHPYGCMPHQGQPHLPNYRSQLEPMVCPFFYLVSTGHIIFTKSLTNWNLREDQQWHFVMH